MTTKILNIKKNDCDVANLHSPSETMLEKVFSFFPLKEEAFLFETIHGHIISFERFEGHYHQFDKGKAKRLDAHELNFFASLTGFRWVEANADTLKIGFTNTPK